MSAPPRLKTTRPAAETRGVPGGGTADAVLSRLDQFGGKLGLEAITLLLAALGRPQDAVPAVLVAGTNGKGSTSALLSAIAGAAGYRTGLYTSPHLERPEERVRLLGRAIAAEELGRLLEEVVGTHQERFASLPSYFEALTAAAYLYYARSAAELAVLEVGLGGRLDATNTCDPSLSVITSVSFDHQEHLGRTLRKIAGEKAGILRAGRPALLWGAPPSVRAALIERAEQAGARWEDVARETRGRLLSAPGQLPAVAALHTPRGEYRLESQLLGKHQLANLALAVRSAEVLAESGFERIDHDAIVSGVARCRWPGRLERVALGDGRSVILDGAHNAAAARVLEHHFRACGEPHDLLFASLATKDVKRILPPLARAARRVFLTAPTSGRAHPPESLRPLAESAGAEKVVIEADPGAALDRALEGLPGTLLACGSLYLVGDLRPLLRARFGVPAPAAEISTG